MLSDILLMLLPVAAGVAYWWAREAKERRIARELEKARADRETLLLAVKDLNRHIEDTEEWAEMMRLQNKFSKYL
ncbi:MAG: hypothetical protein IT210_14315 [Armatimonadetes bacterium]|nr:hypothetical protein [Armatimonadota bacterium]